MTDKVTGRCLCGAVTYEATGPLRDVTACHCEQCRRTSGHFVAATAAARDNFRITRADGLKWYRSSNRARRGFCGSCGASLFWDADDGPTISIMAGTLDSPTNLKLAGHIFTGFAGDYYSLDDGLPSHRLWPGAPDTQ